MALFSSTEETPVVVDDTSSCTISGIDGLSRSTSSSQLTGYPVHTVFLNVYDLHESTSFLAPIGCGLFHAGVEVAGREYCYGRGEHGTGIDQNPPRVCPPHVFREQFVLGVTPLSRYAVEDLFEKLQRDPTWNANRYHLVKHNCVHFAQFVAQKLLPVSCRVSLQPRERSWSRSEGGSSPIFYVGGTQETLLTKRDGSSTTALSATQVQLPSLIPPHVDRLSRFAEVWAPKALVNKLNDWDRASATNDPSGS